MYMYMYLSNNMGLHLCIRIGFLKSLLNYACVCFNHICTMSTMWITYTYMYMYMNNHVHRALQCA